MPQRRNLAGPSRSRLNRNAASRVARRALTTDGRAPIPKEQRRMALIKERRRPFWVVPSKWATPEQRAVAFLLRLREHRNAETRGTAITEVLLIIPGIREWTPGQTGWRQCAQAGEDQLRPKQGTRDATPKAGRLLAQAAKRQTALCRAKGFCLSSPCDRVGGRVCGRLK
jgi:hypothetical protein